MKQAEGSNIEVANPLLSSHASVMHLSRIRALPLSYATQRLRPASSLLRVGGDFCKVCRVRLHMYLVYLQGSTPQS